MKPLLYALLSAAAGVLSGMGLGGGVLLIPALTLLCGLSQHAAQGLNLLSFLPGAAVALLIHRRDGRLQWKPVLPLLPAGAAGAVLGAFLCAGLSGDFLRRAYGILLILLALSRLPRLK